MGKFRIEVKPKAEKELEKHLKSGDKITIKKIEKYFKNLKMNQKTVLAIQKD